MAAMGRASRNSQIIWMARDTLGKRGFRGIKLPLDFKLMLLYYITDRRQFAGNAEEQRRQLLHKIAECAAAGVDYIQLREKDLSSRHLEALAHEAVKAIGRGAHPRLLINSRTDVALASGAAGVHLLANDLAAREMRARYESAETNDSV